MENSPLRVTSETALVIDQLEVTFAYTVAGGTAIASLKIKQLGANTPVTLSVANPSWFTLSQSMNGSAFVSSLSLIPAPEGSLVYIRYTPRSARGHRTFLMVTTPYEVQTVLLKGVPAGLANWFHLPG